MNEVLLQTISNLFCSELKVELTTLSINNKLEIYLDFLC